MLEFVKIALVLTVQSVPKVLPEGSVIKHYFSKLHSFNDNVLYSNKTLANWF